MNDLSFETLQDLIANFSIVTAYLFLASQVIYKDWNLGTPTTLYTKLHIGVLTGILGIILMEFTVKLNGTILDFRHLAITIAALFGGVYAALVTGIMMSLMRLLAFGTLSPATIFAASNTLIISIILGWICTRNLSYWKKWTYALFLNNLFTIIIFHINLGSKGTIPSFIYLIMMTLGGIFTAYLTQFLIKAKTHFQMIEKAATFDFLTELNNHRTFDEAFNSLLLEAKDKNEALTLMIIDIDHFKKVNDTYGHPNGDTVLKQLGKLLKDASRSFDIVSRIGGEEFAILLYDCPHKHALIIGERIRMAVRNQEFLLNEGKVIQITVSVGVATYPDTNENIKGEADKALYKAKSCGRNLVCSNQFA